MNAKKIIAIIGGGLVALGLILTVVFMSVLGWNFTRLDLTEKGQRVKQEFDVAKVTQIKVEVANRKLVVKPSSSGRITLSYQELKREPITLTNVDGLLLIEQQKTEYRFFEDLFSGMFHGLEPGQIILEVPADFDGSFDLATGNAPLIFTGMQSAQFVTLSTSNSRLEASEFTAGNAVLSSSNGPVRVTGANVSSAQFITSNSSLTVQNVVAEKEITIQNANGKIEVEQTSAGSLQTQTSNSGTRLSYCKVSGRLKAQNANGSIGLEAVDALDVSLSTTNASVKGSLAGQREDYRIDARTTNASNNLETNFTGERMLTVRNENGKIDIQFGP